MSKVSMFVCTCLYFLFSACVFAKEVGNVTGFPIPRFVTLKFEKSHLRVGPGLVYKTAFVYNCKNYPLKVIGEFDNWRKVQDHKGVVGWVKQSLVTTSPYAFVMHNKLSSKKSLLYPIKKHFALVFYSQDEASKPIFQVEIGAIVKVKKCKDQWCHVQVSSYSGWMKKVNLWGVL